MRAVTGERSGLENYRCWNVWMMKVVDPAEGTRRKKIRGDIGLDRGLIMAIDATDFTEVTTGCWIFISSEDVQLVRGKGFGNKR